MRKIIWIVVLLAGYYWLVTSGRDQWVLEKGRQICEIVVHRLDDAELDLHWNQHKNLKESPKKSRRWD